MKVFKRYHNRSGKTLGQLVVNDQPRKKRPMAEFDPSVRTALEAIDWDEAIEVVCEGAPAEANVRPAPVARVEPTPPEEPQRRPERRPSKVGPSQILPPKLASAGIRRNEARRTAGRYQGQQAPLSGDSRARLNPKRAGVADQLTGARTGSTFACTERNRRLIQYAPDIQPGIGDEPDVDHNPYGFSAWHGALPFGATDVARATHERWHEGRHSGVVDVTLTARAPVFVPSAAAPARFWRCHQRAADGTESERLALPGSSVKGALRSLFESLTNARAGVTDRENLQYPPLYRRRSSRLFRINRMPEPAGGVAGEAEEVRYDFCDGRGVSLPQQKHKNTLEYSERSAGTVEPWRANLFWVEYDAYSHGSKASIRYARMGRVATFDWDVQQRFLKLKDHPHLTDHPENVAQKSERTGYRDNQTPSYDDAVQNGLFDLKVGDLVFGLVDKEGRLAAFGRNVNFLWPAPVSPLDAMGAFAAREEKEAKLEGSDVAEATFGFVGDHDKDKGTHPFRGRVRFTPFWADSQAQESDEVRLMPLTSPSGTRCKARSLYLRGPKAWAADWGERGVRLAGRKLYWHQRPAPNHQRLGIAKQHVLEEMERNGPPLEMSSAFRKSCVTLRPLPAGTTFKGSVHFTNLSDAELGTLLTALAPHLAFGPGEPERWGWKIGKGKPRGLGSVTGAVSVRLLQPPTQRCRSLASAPFTPAAADSFVEAYRAWAARMNRRGGWDDLEFAQDLKKLLRLPLNPRVRIYPTRFDQYGWMPEFDEVYGEPKHGRPKAMSWARDIPNE